MPMIGPVALPVVPAVPVLLLPPEPLAIIEFMFGSEPRQPVVVAAASAIASVENKKVCFVCVVMAKPFARKKLPPHRSEQPDHVRVGARQPLVRVRRVGGLPQKVVR